LRQVKARLWRWPIVPAMAGTLHVPAGRRIALAVLIVAALLASAMPASAAPPDVSTNAFWASQDADGNPRLKLYFFWSKHCPHCHRALAYLDKLADNLPWLEQHRLEVSERPENVDLFVALSRSVGQQAAVVPAFFFCGQVVLGFDQMETTGRYLSEALLACRRRLLPQARASAPAAAAEPAAQAEPAPLPVPLFGALDPAAWSLPVLTVMLAGLDAFNPCAFFVLLFLLSLLVHLHSRPRMLFVGGVFVAVSGIAYFLFMAAWLNLFLVIGHFRATTAVAGAIALLVATLSIKDYLMPAAGVTMSIPDRARPALFQRMRGLLQASSLPMLLVGTVALAVLANLYELLCTAGLPMVFTRVLTLNELSLPAYYGYLGLYNLIYVVPLFAIVLAFALTLGSRKLSEREGRLLKLLSGTMMAGLGAVLLLAPDLLQNLLTAVALIAVAVLITALVAWATRPPAPRGGVP
jgi:hypothetical protein